MVTPQHQLAGFLKPIIIDGKIATQARLHARGFKIWKEKKNKQKTHWLTHSRESVQTATSLMASFKLGYQFNRH